MAMRSLKFSTFLDGYGISNRIVNTPKEAGVGCGLSVEINKSHLQSARQLVYGVNLPSFAGFFSVKTFQGGRIVKSI